MWIWNEFIIQLQATLEMKGVKEMKALLDILELDPSPYVRIQVGKGWVVLDFDNLV